MDIQIDTLLSGAARVGDFGVAIAGAINLGRWPITSPRPHPSALVEGDGGVAVGGSYGSAECTGTGGVAFVLYGGVVKAGSSGVGVCDNGGKVTGGDGSICHAHQYGYAGAAKHGIASCTRGGIAEATDQAVAVCFGEGSETTPAVPGKASVGKCSVAIAMKGGAARGGQGSVLVLGNKIDGHCKLVCVPVDGTVIRENVFYTLTAGGDVEEADHRLLRQIDEEIERAAAAAVEELR